MSHGHKNRFYGHGTCPMVIWHVLWPYDMSYGHATCPMAWNFPIHLFWRLFHHKWFTGSYTSTSWLLCAARRMAGLLRLFEPFQHQTECRKKFLAAWDRDTHMLIGKQHVERLVGKHRFMLRSFPMQSTYSDFVCINACMRCARVCGYKCTLASEWVCMSASTCDLVGILWTWLCCVLCQHTMPRSLSMVLAVSPFTSNFHATINLANI